MRRWPFKAQKWPGRGGGGGCDQCAEQGGGGGVGGWGGRRGLLEGHGLTLTLDETLEAVYGLLGLPQLFMEHSNISYTRTHG